MTDQKQLDRQREREREREKRGEKRERNRERETQREKEKLKGREEKRGGERDKRRERGGVCKQNDKTGHKLFTKKLEQREPKRTCFFSLVPQCSLSAASQVRRLYSGLEPRLQFCGLKEDRVSRIMALCHPDLGTTRTLCYSQEA